MYHVDKLNNKLVVIYDNGVNRGIVKPPLLQRLQRAWRRFRKQPLFPAQPVLDKMSWNNLIGLSKGTRSFVDVEYHFIAPVTDTKGRPVFKGCEPVTCIKTRLLSIPGGPKVLRELHSKESTQP